MRPALSVVVGAAVALPWLWPWAAPPVPAVPGLLAAWGCTALLWLAIAMPRSEQAGQGAWRPLYILAGVTALAVWRMPVMDLALLGGLVGSAVCVWTAAQSSRISDIAIPRLLCWGLLFGAVASTVIAGFQYSGLLHEPSTLLPWLHASPNEEAYGQLRQRNQFGSLMSLGLAAWFYLARTGWPRRGGRWLAWVSLLALTLGAAASASRTGALTWAALSLLTLLWSPTHNAASPGPTARRGAVVAMLGFVVLSGLLPQLASTLNTVALPKVSVFQRLATQPEGLGICESRTVLWRHVLELSWQRPWLGWGWGELDFVHATQPVAGERFCGQLGHGHNLLLHVAVEWGWPLALLCLGAVAGWIWCHPPWQARTPATLLGWSWLGVIGLHSTLEFPLWYGPFQLAFGLAIGLVIQRPSSELTAVIPPAIPPAVPRSWFFMSRVNSMRSLVALWLAGTLWASWDYHRVSQVFLPASWRSPACRNLPMACLDDVVWFHQGRDFATLRQGLDTLTPLQVRTLAERVAHFAPEPWVLSLTPTAPSTQNR